MFNEGGSNAAAPSKGTGDDVVDMVDEPFRIRIHQHEAKDFVFVGADKTVIIILLDVRMLDIGAGDDEGIDI